ncbi:MAG: hypothetical protein R2690_15880 [Acidimicrobiales bacterium]
MLAPADGRPGRGGGTAAAGRRRRHRCGARPPRRPRRGAEAYAAVATLVVDVDHRPVDEVVEAILSGVAHPEVPS